MAKKNNARIGKGNSDSKELDEILDTDFLKQPYSLGSNLHSLQSLRGYFTHDLGHMSTKTAVSSQKSNYFVREVLKKYLSYVNAKIVLSNEPNVGFHDWMDFQPFYRQKFKLYLTESRFFDHPTFSANTKADTLIFPRSKF